MELNCLYVFIVFHLFVSCKTWPRYGRPHPLYNGRQQKNENLLANALLLGLDFNELHMLQALGYDNFGFLNNGYPMNSHERIRASQDLDQLAALGVIENQEELAQYKKLLNVGEPGPTEKENIQSPNKVKDQNRNHHQPADNHSSRQSSVKIRKVSGRAGSTVQNSTQNHTEAIKLAKKQGLTRQGGVSRMSTPTVKKRNNDLTMTNYNKNQSARHASEGPTTKTSNSKLSLFPTRAPNMLQIHDIMLTTSKKDNKMSVKSSTERTNGTQNNTLLKQETKAIKTLKISSSTGNNKKNTKTAKTAKTERKVLTKKVSKKRIKSRRQFKKGETELAEIKMKEKPEIKTNETQGYRIGNNREASQEVGENIRPQQTGGGHFSYDPEIISDLFGAGVGMFPLIGGANWFNQNLMFRRSNYGPFFF